MKNSLRIVLLLILSIGLGFLGGALWQRHKTKARKRAFRADIYTPTAKGVVTKEEKPMVLVSLSYNNSDYCEESLRSLLSQKYTNFRVVYVDDASTDDTYEKVSQFVRAHDTNNRVTLIRNKTNQGAMANFYSIIHTCKPSEIIVTVDGDDKLVNDQVLYKLNSYYANQDVWMTFGQYIETPRYKRGISAPLNNSIVQKKGVRGHPFVASHLRTFYAGLFHQIKKEDFLYKGLFYPKACDVAIMLPLLEMSEKHAYFVDEVLYQYRFDNPISDHNVDNEEQVMLEEHVRQKPPYAPLKERPLVRGDERE